ncbi:MAG TPA: NADPH-dependent FMN reductase [Nitriliruptorales bacterium]|nr:NADPH-dependent FMN reductase [Nitriliruptorales bacterium]
MNERILLLGGSLTTPSRSEALLYALADQLVTNGARPTVWNLAADTLPAPHRRHGTGATGSSGRLVQAARDAEGYVLVSPVYHGSFSGALKDALDHLRIDHVAGKPVALASTAGRHPTSQAVDQLRLVVRSLHAVAIPAQLLTAEPDYDWSGRAFGLTGSAIIERLERLVDELLWFTAAFRRPTVGTGAVAVAERALRRSDGHD